MSANPQTRHEPNRHFVEVVGQMRDGSDLASQLVSFGTIRHLCQALRVVLGHEFLIGALIIDLNLLLHGAIRDDEDPPVLAVASIRTGLTGAQDLLDKRLWNRIRLQTTHGAHAENGLEKVDVAFKITSVSARMRVVIDAS